MRFLVDTNILISASMFPTGKVAFLLAHVLESHTLVIASYTLAECQTVFERKFPEKKDAFSTFLQEITFEIYETPEEIDATKFPSIRDSKDLPILASAILSTVDILLTGDKEFQDVPVRRPIVFTPAQYWELIKD